LHYFFRHSEPTCQNSIKDMLIYRGQKVLFLLNRIFASLYKKRREAVIRNIPTQISPHDLTTNGRVVPSFVNIEFRPMRASWFIGRASPFE